MTATNALQVIIVEDRHEDAELMVHELRREGFEVRHRRVDTAADFADGPIRPKAYAATDLTQPSSDSSFCVSTATAGADSGPISPSATIA